MVRKAFTFHSLLACTAAFAQTAPATYWVTFTDKANTPYSLQQPDAFLSERALDRRQRQGIPVDELDLPVDPGYISALLAAGQFELHSVSRWFNAVTIVSTDTLALDTLHLLPFVQEVRASYTRTKGRHALPAKFPPPDTGIPKGLYDDVYGPSFGQSAMINAHLLHTLGSARGEGLLIGVFDSGFEDTDSLEAFATLRARNGIVYTRDIVCPHCDVYDQHWHGRSVLSTMAGVLPGRLLGTAPDADYALFRTEDVHSEYPVEEDNWISGAEVADSLGCDLLNTSLGYTVFDDSTMDHTYAQLDGNTVRMSIAANIALRKGMIPVNSAGNEGSSDWHYIGVPADAVGILTVGAVGTFREPAPFSSRGPTADGRVKPDVCATGWGCIGLDIDGTNIGSISGTSFSSPVLCGAVACLWQLHRDLPASAIINAVKRSASLYHTPNDSLGHGIPDLWRAHLLLGGNDLTGLQAPAFFQAYPLPFTDHLDLELFTGEAVQLELELVDILGRSTLLRPVALPAMTYQQVRIDDPALHGLSSGSYILRASLAGRAEITRHVLKAD